MKSKLVAIIMVIAVLLPFVPEKTVYAEKLSDSAFISIERIELSEEEGKALREKLDELEEAEETVKNDLVSSNDYINNYFYDYLNSNEKEFYDEADRICSSYMNSSSDIQMIELNEEERYYMGYVNVEDLTEDEIYETYMYFFVNQSQYFYLDNCINYDGQYIYMSVYDVFADAASRNEARDMVFSVIDEYVTEASKESSKYLQMKNVYERMCEKITYGWTDYSQSVYSSVTNRTVCTGYSRLFQMVLNKLGIMTINVTSETHCWNKVYYAGRWYVVDVTWGDGSRKTDYSYFLTSDSRVNNKDHLLEDFETNTVPESAKIFDPSEVITGICQMPYNGGFLVGLTVNEDTAKTVEMLIYNCSTELWEYSTGRIEPVDNSMWTIWEPVYGYYWTLFRAYDEEGNIIDEICYGFANI